MKIQYCFYLFFNFLFCFMHKHSCYFPATFCVNPSELVNFSAFYRCVLNFWLRVYFIISWVKNYPFPYSITETKPIFIFHHNIWYWISINDNASNQVWSRFDHCYKRKWLETDNSGWLDFRSAAHNIHHKSQIQASNAI